MLPTRRLTLILVLLLCVPLTFYLVGTLVGLFRHVTLRLVTSYVCCPVAMDALKISMITTLASTFLAVIFGMPLAYVMAHHRFRGREILDTLIDLPLVLPPAAAGLALLLTFGNKGIGPLLNFRFTGATIAVIMAQLFVASPFFIKQARTGFEAISTNLKVASMTLGASAWRTFFKITLPLSKRSLIAGATMTWARALGEFGATVTFAGALQGRTETMPVAVYNAAQFNLEVAIVLAATLVAVSFLVLISTKAILGRTTTVV